MEMNPFGNILIVPYHSTTNTTMLSIFFVVVGYCNSNEKCDITTPTLFEVLICMLFITHIIIQLGANSTLFTL